MCRDRCQENNANEKKNNVLTYCVGRVECATRNESEASDFSLTDRGDTRQFRF